MAALLAAYTRRKQFEARLLAAELMRALAVGLGGKPGGGRSTAKQVKPGELLKLAGATIGG